MNRDDTPYRIDRRLFLRMASLAGATGLIVPRTLLSSLAPSGRSRVVIVEDNTATSGTSIVRTTVQTMMDRGIAALAGQSDVGEAWKALLPNISPSSVVAVKVNCLFSTMSTHPDVTYAAVESLKKMSFDGTPFPENNIVIYDNTSSLLRSAGYTINTSRTGVWCFGSSESIAGYATTSYSVSGRSQRLSKIVTDMANYIVNIAVLKNHSMAGITLCLKNHYGTCNNPGQLHDGYCDPYIPALNALAPIKDKQCVNIIDALFGASSGGPSGNPQFTANKLVLGQDIVAVDYQGREILREKGCRTLSYATHIDTAAAKYGLGTVDPAQMEVVNIANPTADPPSSEPADPRADFNGNGAVDFPDFLEFARQFGKSSADAGFEPRFDLDSSGAVGFTDFLQFVKSFGKQVGG